MSSQNFRTLAALLLVVCFGLGLAGCGGGEGEQGEIAAAPVHDLATAGAASESQTGEVSSAPRSDHPTLVFLGDSLTAGFGLAATEALPEQIAERFERAGIGVNIVNAGVSGDTTGGGLARYDWSVRSVAPDLVFVALGANDYLSGGEPEQARENLRAILTQIEADGAQAVLASVEARSSGIDDPRAEAFSGIYPELAAEFDVPHFVGLLAKVRGRADLLLSDGLHPTAEGIGLMADDIAAFLGPFVIESREARAAE